MAGKKPDKVVTAIATTFQAVEADTMDAIRRDPAHMAANARYLRRAVIEVDDDRRPYLAMIPTRIDASSRRPRRPYYRADLGNITFGRGDIAVTPLTTCTVDPTGVRLFLFEITFADQAAEHPEHVAENPARGAPHPNPASMTNYLPVTDRLNVEIGR